MTPFDGLVCRTCLLTLPFSQTETPGPWRESHRLCYHKACDDLSQLTAANLGQLMRSMRLLRQLLLDYELD